MMNLKKKIMFKIKILKELVKRDKKWSINKNQGIAILKFLIAISHSKMKIIYFLVISFQAIYKSKSIKTNNY